MSTMKSSLKKSGRFNGPEGSPSPLYQTIGGESMNYGVGPNIAVKGTMHNYGTVFQQTPQAKGYGRRGLSE